MAAAATVIFAVIVAVLCEHHKAIAGPLLVYPILQGPELQSPSSDNTLVTKLEV